MDRLATLVVVPRERFGGSVARLEGLLRDTRAPVEGIVVDGGSPRRVARRLARLCAREGLDYVRTEHYLSPNEARNLAIPRVRTRYTAFVDNDVVATPGWLEPLLRCAEETGAWVVGPVTCVGTTPLHERIHAACSVAHIAGGSAGRRLVVEHTLQHESLARHRGALRRGTCEAVEFHGMLVRTEAFAKLGPLDEDLLSLLEHVDFCLSVREAGGSIWLEPASVATYVPPPPFAPSDVPYYLLRWSDAWTRTTLEHFKAKWSLDEDFTRRLRWVGRKRDVVFAPLRERAVALLGERRGAKLARRIARRAERRLLARAVRRRARTDRP